MKNVDLYDLSKEYELYYLIEVCLRFCIISLYQ